ncbi:MAG: aminopeptidase P family protein [Elusimicrobiota bacterium]|jgi:Xaa-Pro aminopeptidase|nr:aminopeptidase P family protein [Elusimicrobiota bacterium]
MKNSDEKIKNFQKYLKLQKIQAFAVMDYDSLNYLSDFHFSTQKDALLLITQTKAFCFTKELYAINLRKAAPYLTLIISLNPADIVKKVKELKIKNAAFDPELISYIPGNMFKKAGFIEMTGEISKLREVKLPSEISKIQKACQISAKAYEIFRKKLKAGITEIEAAKMLEEIMFSLGGQGLAFETIMAFGSDGANPHHVNSKRKLKNNEPVLMDYGCKYGDYCSDITRAFWYGGKPSKEFTKIYDIVKSAHDITLKSAKIAMSGNELDAVCRNYIEEKSGLSKHFIHSTGHSLGIAIHEAPFVRINSADILRENSVFTIEPGLYFEGKLGVRYENTVLLTKTGAKILTK